MNRWRISEKGKLRSKLNKVRTQALGSQVEGIWEKERIIQSADTTNIKNRLMDLEILIFKEIQDTCEVIKVKYGITCIVYFCEDRKQKKKI